MLLDAKLAREPLTKVVKNWKGDYQNRNKKDSGSTSKDAYVLDRYTEYLPIGTTYT